MERADAGATQATGVAAIDEAAARNVSIELRSLGRDGRPMTARSRILGTEAGCLLLDQPQRAGEPVAFRVGQALDAGFRLNEQRYSFKSQVEDVSRLLPLNEHKKVVGVVITRPQEVQLAPQRRDHYRVRLLGHDPIVLDLHQAAPDGSGHCPIDARRFQAEMVDLSAGGTGVRLSKEAAAALEVGELLFLSFTLPDEDEAFTFLAKVRQLRPGTTPGDGRLGLEICDRPIPRVVQRARQRLQHYLMRVQRSRLRRRR